MAQKFVSKWLTFWLTFTEGFLTFVSIAEETQRPVPHHKVFPGVSDAMAAKRRQYLALKAVR